MLYQQGIGWVTRKAIGLATITLKIREAPSADDKTVYQIDIDQIVTGGIKGTSEARTTDWQERGHKDHIFGSVVGRSRLLRGSQGEDGKFRPNVQVQTELGGDGVDEAKIQKFLRGEILLDGSEGSGFLADDAGEDLGQGQGLFLQTWVVNQDAGWTAEQVWGFEIVNDQRHYTRRVVIVKNGKYQLARLVYSYQGSREE
ncbi:hypothetical protein ASPZODRAFT_61361 [Penicilliopsis zonata CBS 506.65]|uniref:Uncharacterized protein n=1 Tax=Penicilliopsis zonata CBS 506.65 TaxID=1073090 RepID=A0A1L9SQE8_9EURO|nr:hypothetical protein ASPZODRAFT_61361 [Penicilliopsis zonata CBS 506.65]OJJ49304.1 hypothetical protein ASPZODRAFT_61361 [Penicilliopsis zonata CBS 506.65]